MPIYVALLRGINVSGHKSIKMEALRELLASLGFEDVQTYVQSGNVVFKTSNSSVPTIKAKVMAGIERKFGETVPTLIIPATNLRKIIQKNPFLNEKRIDDSKLHVTFLSQPPSELVLAKLSAIKTNDDSYHCIGDAVYLSCPHGYGGTKLSNNTIEKTLQVQATTRNWRTVRQLGRLVDT